MSRSKNLALDDPIDEEINEQQEQIPQWQKTEKKMNDLERPKFTFFERDDKEHSQGCGQWHYQAKELLQREAILPQSLLVIYKILTVIVIINVLYFSFCCLVMPVVGMHAVQRYISSDIRVQFIIYWIIQPFYLTSYVLTLGKLTLQNTRYSMIFGIINLFWHILFVTLQYSLEHKRQGIFSPINSIVYYLEIVINFVAIVLTVILFLKLHRILNSVHKITKIQKQNQASKSQIYPANSIQQQNQQYLKQYENQDQNVEQSQAYQHTEDNLNVFNSHESIDKNNKEEGSSKLMNQKRKDEKRLTKMMEMQRLGIQDQIVPNKKQQIAQLNVGNIKDRYKSPSKKKDSFLQDQSDLGDPLNDSKQHMISSMGNQNPQKSSILKQKHAYDKNSFMENSKQVSFQGNSIQVIQTPLKNDISDIGSTTKQRPSNKRQSVALNDYEKMKGTTPTLANKQKWGKQQSTIYDKINDQDYQLEETRKNKKNYDFSNNE